MCLLTPDRRSTSRPDPATMGLVNYLRNKLKKSKAKKAQELHEEPLLVPHPPSSDHEWQKVDSREGSLGIEPDINL